MVHLPAIAGSGEVALLFVMYPTVDYSNSEKAAQ